MNVWNQCSVCGFNVKWLRHELPFTLFYVFYINFRTIQLYINTILFTLLHCCLFQPSRGHPQGVLTHFVSRVNKMHVKM